MQHWLNQITNNISMQYQPILCQSSISIPHVIIRRFWFSYVLEILKQNIGLKWVNTTYQSYWSSNIAIFPLYKDGWIRPSTRKLVFTRLLIRIDYASSPQSCQAALRVPEPILTSKMFKKKFKLSKYFVLREYFVFLYLVKRQKNRVF